MCKIGDIIVVNSYKGDDGIVLKSHSFIVLDDTLGTIEGCSYDLICNVMSSFRNKPGEYKTKKLKYQENLGVTKNDISVIGNTEEGYIKADKLYFFEKSKLSYAVIGNINPDIFEKLLVLIQKLQEKGKLINVTLNL